ncbi:MAG: hypothetical protein ABIY38_08110 [Rhodococcus sp. (in: high G+C Gram-positive bacteria)]
MLIRTQKTRRSARSLRVLRVLLNSAGRGTVGDRDGLPQVGLGQLAVPLAWDEPTPTYARDTNESSVPWIRRSKSE